MARQKRMIKKIWKAILIGVCLILLLSAFAPYLLR